MNETRPVHSTCSTSSAQQPRQRRRLRQLALLLPALVGLQGCASLTHYNAVRDLDGAPGIRSEAILMDAKQRGVYTITRTEKDGAGKVLKAIQSFCAEPSPDALSNLAAQFGATVNVDTRGGGSINGGFSEGAANIGLRTTSIQILRDITYRQCEAYANGGISKLGLETLQRRFQSTMVALLSIEQLTGAVRAPAVVLTGNSSANNAELVASLTQKTETARSAVTEGEADLKSKATAAAVAMEAAKKLSTADDADKAEIKRLEAKSPQTEDDKKKIADLKAAVTKRQTEIADAATASKAADDAVADATKTLGERKQSLAAIDTARKASLTVGGTTSTTGEIRPMVIPSTLDSNAATAVAGAVTSIVHDTLALGYGQEVCTSIIGDQTDPARAEVIARMRSKASVAPTNASETDERTDAQKAAAQQLVEDRINAQLAETKETSQSVLGKCLDLIGADAGYYARLGAHLDAKTALINAVATSISKCAANDGCSKNTATVKELVNALKIASEAQVGASPVLLTR